MQLLNVADTVEIARPAVVSIVAEARIRGVYGDVYSVFGNGTGVIFDAKGLVLTNTHVVDRATTITVTMDDGSQEKATIIGADPMSDLAVLQLPGSNYPHLPLSSGASPRVGDWVIAIGNALALPGGPTVTVGVVSALGRSLDVSPEITLYNLIQTDTVINPGSSGGGGALESQWGIGGHQYGGAAFLPGRHAGRRGGLRDQHGIREPDF